MVSILSYLNFISYFEQMISFVNLRIYPMGYVGEGPTAENSVRG